jgi:hypothetical protein
VAQRAKGFVLPTKHVKKEQPHCEGNIRVKEDDKIASLVVLRKKPYNRRNVGTRD